MYRLKGRIAECVLPSRIAETIELVPDDHEASRVLRSIATTTGARTLLDFLTVPGNHRCRHRQNQVVIAGAEIVNFESSDPVRSSPHDYADLPASGRMPGRVGNDARALFRCWCGKVDAGAPAFAPSDNFEVWNRSPQGLIEMSHGRALQGGSDNFSLAVIDASVLGNHGCMK